MGNKSTYYLPRWKPLEDLNRRWLRNDRLYRPFEYDPKVDDIWICHEIIRDGKNRRIQLFIVNALDWKIRILAGFWVPDNWNDYMMFFFAVVEAERELWRLEDKWLGENVFNK